MTKDLVEIFNKETLLELLPLSRSDEFFEALYGDASEGAYDISLAFISSPKAGVYNFDLNLNQRPGKCLACNLTHGLPEVFSRHPVINLKGLAAAIATCLSLSPDLVTWQLGSTQSISKVLYSIPFIITAE